MLLVVLGVVVLGVVLLVVVGVLVIKSNKPTVLPWACCRSRRGTAQRILLTASCSVFVLLVR